jgi:hypothetical protein
MVGSIRDQKLKIFFCLLTLFSIADISYVQLGAQIWSHVHLGLSRFNQVELDQRFKNVVIETYILEKGNVL